MADGVQRRLSAIVCADVAGYSRLVGLDEEGTLTRLKTLRRELIDPKIAEHHGRIVKTTGDGLLLEFGSVVDAMRSAIAVQQHMAQRNDDVPTDQCIEFRIGIHMGDIVIDGEDILGDGVNVAARLEALSEPGGICISGRVQEDLVGKLDLVFQDIGEQALKNIARPVRVWRWLPDRLTSVSPKAASADLPLPLPEKPSIAVLPFDNMSGDPEQGYFADGISEDIITELTRFRSLFVIARNSSFSYKGKSPDVRDVGRELGVRYVLEGSVRKAGSRVRLTGQLIDARTGNHIWAERYDRQLDDVFTVQEELTRSIVRAIAPHISEAELVRVRRRRPENLTAYEIGVRAHATALDAFARSDRELCNEALRLARSALAVDPDNVTALIARTLAQAQHLWRRTATDREATWKDATEAIERLLELEPFSSLGHVWKAHMLMLTPGGARLEDALALARQGHALNPHDMTTLIGTAFVENLAGEPERAIELGQEALRVSPRDPLRPHMRQQLTMACFAAKRYEAAIEYAKLALAEAPGLPPVLTYLAASYAALGRYDEARSALQAARKAGPEYVENLLSGTQAIGKGAGLRACLRVAAGLEDQSAAEASR